MTGSQIWKLGEDLLMAIWSTIITSQSRPWNEYFPFPRGFQRQGDTFRPTWSTTASPMISLCIIAGTPANSCWTMMWRNRNDHQTSPQRNAPQMHYGNWEVSVIAATASLVCNLLIQGWLYLTPSPTDFHDSHSTWPNERTNQRSCNE